MTTVKMSVAAAGLGNPVIGNYGTYQVGSDGLITADSRDVPALLVAGATYITGQTRSYGQTLGAATAAVGKFVASVALAIGALTVANQPDVITGA